MLVVTWGFVVARQVVVLVFGGWEVACLTVESSVVVPVGVRGGGEFDVGQCLSGPLGLRGPALFGQGSDRLFHATSRSC